MDGVSSEGTQILMELELKEHKAAVRNGYNPCRLIQTKPHLPHLELNDCQIEEEAIIAVLVDGMLGEGGRTKNTRRKVIRILFP